MNPQSIDQTKFKVIGDDTELQSAIEFCNKHKNSYNGVLSEAANRMSNRPTNAQISSVLSGKAAYTNRNLEILDAIFKAIKLEVEKTVKLRNSIVSIDTTLMQAS